MKNPLSKLDVKLAINKLSEKLGIEVERPLKIFTSDGYDCQTNRTYFFCVEGSPNKLYGCIDAHNLSASYAIDYVAWGTKPVRIWWNNVDQKFTKKNYAQTQ